MGIAILGSTRGTNLKGMMEAIHAGDLPVTIDLVISNKRDAPILELAKQYNLPAIFMDPTNLSREEYDGKVSACLLKHDIELIILIGYMRILSADFVRIWKHKIINVHPSLLPKFAGKMDLAVHQAVIDAKVNETGCTVHYVTEKVDAGPILLQKKCPVLPSDTAEILKARVQKLESEALVELLTVLSS